MDTSLSDSNKDSCIPGPSIDITHEVNSENKKNEDEKKFEDRKLREAGLTDEQKNELYIAAEELRKEGNQHFGTGNFEAAENCYSSALETVPLEFKELRAILFSNRAASKIKLEQWKAAVQDCTDAIQLGPLNEKPLERRAFAYAKMDDTLEKAIEDYKQLLERKPNHHHFIESIKAIEAKIEVRNEKMKTEMMSTLKNLGNMVLKPFGLSTESFEMVQQPGGGYSINMKK